MPFGRCARRLERAPLRSLVSGRGGELMSAERRLERPTAPAIIGASGNPRRDLRLAGRRTVHEHERAQGEAAPHIALAEALAEWEGIATGFTRLLADLADSLDCQAGVLWVPRDDRLRPRVVWLADAEGLREFKAMTLTSRLPRGVEAPGQVWQSLEPSNQTGRNGLAPPRGRAARAAGLRTTIAFPAIWADELIAVIELMSQEEFELTSRLKRSLTAISYVLGLFLAHHRGMLDDPVITDRQVEILRLAAQGLSSRQIAERLLVSRSTVKTHFENIYERLGVKHRASAVAAAMRLGLVD